MKKKLILLSFISLISAYFVINRSVINTNENKPDSSPAPVLGETYNSNSLQIGDFQISWFEVSDKQVSLIANFAEKETTSNLFVQNSCVYAANAGFYSRVSTDTSYKPIGLYITDREKLSSFRSNYIFNGIFSQNLLGTPRITKEVPKDELVWAVQSGPVIKENNQYYNYSSQTDKESRRILAGVTGDNQIVFLTIFNPKSFFDGPKLSEVSSLIEKFEQQSGVLLADVINLDGGSASAFYGVDTVLKEISPVGSLFCVK